MCRFVIGNTGIGAVDDLRGFDRVGMSFESDTCMPLSRIKNRIRQSGITLLERLLGVVKFRAIDAFAVDALIHVHQHLRRDNGRIARG